jgi:hypothetical protein
MPDSVLSDSTSSKASWFDYNNDNKLDILIANPLKVFTNNGNSTFSVHPQTNINWTGCAGTADFNNDGNIDIAPIIKITGNNCVLVRKLEIL